MVDVSALWWLVVRTYYIVLSYGAHGLVRTVRPSSVGMRRFFYLLLVVTAEQKSRCVLLLLIVDRSKGVSKEQTNKRTVVESA